MSEEKPSKYHVLSFLKPYRGPAIAASLLIVLECALEITVPFLSNLVFKNGLKAVPGNGTITYDMDKDYVLLVALLMLAFAGLAMLIGVFTAKFTAKAGRGLGYELRRKEYEKILDFSFANLDEFRINSLVTRMTNDVQIISDTFCQALRPLLRAPIQLLLSLGFAIYMSRQLSLVFAVVLPLLAALLVFLILLTRPLFVKLQDALDKINRTTEESLIAMKLVRANAKKDYEIEKFQAVNAETKHIGDKALGINALNMAVIQSMTYLCILGILFFGGRLGLKRSDAVMTANMATYLDYVQQMLNSLVMLSNVFMMFTRASASNERLKEVFEAKSEIVDPKESPLTVSDGRILFDHVSFRYAKTAQEATLSDLSFEISSGSFVGILGETGSGKSTLVSLIDRFYDASEGKILIAGKPIQDYSLHNLREGISIAFQSPRLFTGTVRDNLRWGNPDATEAEMDEALKIAGCYDVVMKQLPQGYETPMGQTGSNVSGGQRQRLCIARALLKKPKILILDDSFSALDRITEGEVKKNLRTKLPGMTVLVISQKISTINDADLVLVLKDGKMEGKGTPAELLAHDPIYQHIASIQKEGR